MVPAVVRDVVPAVVPAVTPTVIPAAATPIPGSSAADVDTAPPSGDLVVEQMGNVVGVCTAIASEAPARQEKRRIEDKLDELELPTTVRGPGRPRKTRRLDHYKKIPKSFADLPAKEKKLSKFDLKTNFNQPCQ